MANKAYSIIFSSSGQKGLPPIAKQPEICYNQSILVINKKYGSKS